MNLFNPDRLIIFPADDPQLVKQLQNDTKVYLAKSGDHRYADGWAFTKMAVLVIACFSCYLLALSQHQWGLYLLWYLATMFCAMLLAVNVVHDASHDAFLRGKKANVWLNRLVAFPMGLDPDCWRVRHVRFHHGFTNIEFYDPDTAENGILRQTPWQRWRPFMRQQHRYWPLVAALTFPWYIWVVDWFDRAGVTPVTRHLSLRGFAGWCIQLYDHFADVSAKSNALFTALRHVDYWYALGEGIYAITARYRQNGERAAGAYFLHDL